VTNLVFYSITVRDNALILAFSGTSMLKLLIYLRPFARYLLIGWLLTMIILSSLPNIPTLKVHMAKSEIRLDYLLHFCEYGVLTFMTFLSFAGNEFKISYTKIILIAASLILFAVLDELHQKLIPGRTCSVKDMASDVMGVITAIIFTIILFRIIKDKIIHPI
jgi:VanZ family protein